MYFLWDHEGLLHYMVPKEYFITGEIHSEQEEVWTTVCSYVDQIVKKYLCL